MSCAGRWWESGVEIELTLVNIARGRPAVSIDRLVGDSTGSTVNSVISLAALVSNTNCFLACSFCSDVSVDTGSESVSSSFNIKLELYKYHTLDIGTQRCND